MAVLPGAASAAGGGSLEVPGTVVAGQFVELTWHGIPADVEEMELLLSLDGGRGYHVRVSPELDGREGSYRWRVPDLPTGTARLMLRVGGEEGERVGATSREFRILHAADAPRPDLVFHEGVLWTGFGPMRGPLRATFAPETASFEDASDRVPLDSPSPALRAGRPATARAPVLPMVTARGPGGVPVPSAPREVPLRI
jgi:hypothetical protein